MTYNPSRQTLAEVTPTPDAELVRKLLALLVSSVPDDEQ